MLLAVAMISTMILGLASCGISKDPSKVKEELKDEGYGVIVLDSLSDMRDYDIDEACDYLGISLDNVESIIMRQQRTITKSPS